jgi:hypothetical protein
MTAELAERLAASAALALGIALLAARTSAPVTAAGYVLTVYGLGWHALRAAAPHPGSHVRSKLRARPATGDARPLTRPVHPRTALEGAATTLPAAQGPVPGAHSPRTGPLPGAARPPSGPARPPQLAHYDMDKIRRKLTADTAAGWPQ